LWLHRDTIQILYLNIDHWKDESTVKYDIEDCITFKIRALGIEDILKKNFKETRYNNVIFTVVKLFKEKT